MNKLGKAFTTLLATTMLYGCGDGKDTKIPQKGDGVNPDQNQGAPKTPGQNNNQNQETDGRNPTDTKLANEGIPKESPKPKATPSSGGSDDDDKLLDPTKEFETSLKILDFLSLKNVEAKAKELFDKHIEKLMKKAQEQRFQNIPPEEDPRNILSTSQNMLHLAKETYFQGKALKLNTKQLEQDVSRSRILVFFRLVPEAQQQELQNAVFEAFGDQRKLLEESIDLAK